jgi:cytochrome b6-f complex iron-sulfur subunit
MNRRGLIHRVLMGGAVLVMVPSVLESCTKIPENNADSGSPAGGTTVTPNKIDLDLTLSDNTILNSAGGSRMVESLIVINTGNGKYSALSGTCTHAGCTVGYNSGSGKIECPCHGSVFTTSGRSYSTSVVGNILTITL